MQGPAERAREVGVGGRLRRGEIEGAGRVRIGDERGGERGPVVHVNPGHPLPARAEPAADAEREGQPHLGERALAAEHQAGAQQHEPAGLARGSRGGFPGGGHRGHEVAACRRVFADGFVAARAVVAHARGAHEYARAARYLLHGLYQTGGGFEPAVEQRGLAGVGPARVSHAFAGQIDDHIGAGQGVRPGADLAVRRPLDVAGPIGPGATRQRRHAVATRGEHLFQGAPEEAGPARHHDMHDPL